MILSDVEDMTYKEIAEALSIPKYCDVASARGRRLLREELAAYAPALGSGETDETKSARGHAGKQEGGEIKCNVVISASLLTRISAMNS